MTTTNNNPSAVRTKTGNKVHLAPHGSSRTYCGVRFATTLKKIHTNSEGCQACGIAPETTGSTLAQWLGLPLVGGAS